MSDHVWVVQLKEGKAVEVTAARMERERGSLRFYDSDRVLNFDEPLVAVYADGAWVSCHRKDVIDAGN